ATALAALVDAPAGEIRARAFNLSPLHGNHRILDLARAVEAAIPGTRLTVAAGAATDARDYRVSGARIAALLGDGWARTGIEEGIAEIVAALDGRAPDPEAFEGPRFARVAHLRNRIETGALGPDLRPRPRATAAAS
ncbi:MAG: hypothetical protein AAFZ07_29870, partial [Actinomycetota bacterium]